MGHYILHFFYFTSETPTLKTSRSELLQNLTLFSAAFPYTPRGKYLLKLTVAWERTRLFPDVGLNNILCSKRNICLFLSWAATVSDEGPEEENCSRWKLALQLFGEGMHPCSCRIFPLDHKNQGSGYSSKYPGTTAAWQPANKTGNISVIKSHPTNLKGGLRNRCPKICECILFIMDVF